jgi:MFS transporter, DHA2 family, methylenomycin A resistance protein
MLVGLAGPTVIPSVIAALLSAVQVHRAGTASGVLNTSRQLDGALAVAVFGPLISAPSGFEAGMRASLLLAAAIAAAAALAGIAGLRPRT